MDAPGVRTASLTQKNFYNISGSTKCSLGLRMCATCRRARQRWSLAPRGRRHGSHFVDAFVAPLQQRCDQDDRSSTTSAQTELRPLHLGVSVARSTRNYHSWISSLL